MQTMPPYEFARRLHDTFSNGRQDVKYSLLLGAGCSISSSIPGSATLIRDFWLPKLHALKAPDLKLADWMERHYDVTPSHIPANAYGKVFKDLFATPAERQLEIERICEGVTPGFGYATLAQLISMSKGRLSVILTTNFDDLLADALYLFSRERPVVIPHGALSQYIRPSPRPLIVKLHGHYQYSLSILMKKHSESTTN